MDEHYVKTIVEGLKSSSSRRVQDSLLKIKSKIISTNEGIKLFAECGGLKCLVSHIRKPNERILGLALSILGNCSLNDDCRLEVGKLHGVPPLITVLKTVCRDSIVGRACRVIGNLAQRQSNAEDLHMHGVVPALVALIESRDKNTSYPTLTMAVRALRQLWIVTNKREEMLRVNSVRCIAILLTTECEAAGMLKSDNPQLETLELRKSQEELISGILKCLAYFTTHATASCAEQVQGDGRGYQCLVALTKTFESLALRCLMNLCFVSSCRPLIGNAGLVPCLVSILQRNTDVCWWPEGAARTLAQLSGESVNRARIRHSGGLPLLLAAAKEHTFALKALLQYIFDDASFQILVNAGLLNFLIDEMKKHLLTMKYEHENIDAISDSSDEETDNEKVPGVHFVREKTGLFTRRKSSCIDSMSVVLERDDIYIGFNDTFESDPSYSPNEDESPQKSRKRLKRTRSKSPTGFLEVSREAVEIWKLRRGAKVRFYSQRCRGWGTGVYWEAKCDRDGASTSKNQMIPEAGPMSPVSEGGSGFSPDYRAGKRRRDWSPESGFSTGEASAASPYWTDYQWSPSSSGPTSPFSVNNEESSDSEVSGRYSPVCNEEAEAETPEETTAEVTSSVNVEAAQTALDELNVTDTDAEQDEDNYDVKPIEAIENMSYLDTNSPRIAFVFVLLYRVLHGSYDSNRPQASEALPKDTIEQISGKDCVDALLDFMQRSRRPKGRAARILKVIFTNPLCLRNILKNKIPLRLHDMSRTTRHHVKQCQQCRLIKNLSGKLLTRLLWSAESKYGIGEISYQLLRGPDCMKETLSLMLPYIVKTKKVLRKYFIECNALTVLFAGVLKTSEDLDYYVTALGKLSTNLRIKDPKLLEKRFSNHVCVSYDPILDGLSDEEIVTFELDDSSTVRANKTFLCQNSEVFSAMLLGCFRESIEESVRIKDVTKAGLEYLLTLLHCGLNDSKCNIEIIPMADKLETNLEVLLLADRFLFEKLKASLNSAILQFKMTPDTADKIYAWSLGEGMGFLCVESVAYLLTGKMCETDRSQAFNNILNLKYKEQWLDDIKSVIKRQLDEYDWYE